MLKPDNYKSITILWWNVNRRLDFILKNISPINTIKPDIIFVADTSIGYDALPNINGYILFADKTVRVCNHGGIALYVKHEYAPTVFELNFNTCYIYFRLDFVPSIIFIGSYIQPEFSKYFDVSMFGELSDLLMTVLQKNLVPYFRWGFKL